MIDIIINGVLYAVVREELTKSFTRTILDLLPNVFNLETRKHVDPVQQAASSAVEETTEVAE